jgi:hypothetical protein
MHVRDFVTSNATAIAVGLLLTIGGVLIAMDQFRFAEAIFVLAALWGVLWLWRQPYQSARFDILFLAVTIGVMSGLIFFTEDYRIKRILELNHGWLEPANYWTPMICGDPIDHKYKIIWMPELSVALAKFPDPIIKINDQELLPVDLKNGLLSVSVNVFDKYGRVVAVIKDNEFTINANNILRKENHNFSSLKIYDQYNQVVLDVRYANVNVIKIKGVLRYDGSTIIINNDGLFLDGQVMMIGFCMVFDQPSTAFTFNVRP